MRAPVDRVVRRGAGAVGVLGIALAVAAAPVTRAVIGARARTLGLTVDVKRVGVGLGVLRLAGVTLTSAALPGITVELEHVDVTPGLGLSPRRVEIHGGAVHLRGSARELEARLQAYRDTRSIAGGAAPDRVAVMPLLVNGIDVDWATRPPSARDAHVWGASYQRDRDGREIIGADLVRVALAGTSFEASFSRAELEKKARRRIVRALSSRALSAVLDLDAVNEDTDDVGEPAPSAGSPTISVVISTPPGDLGPRLRAKIARAAERVAAWLDSPGKVELSGARFELRHDGQTLNVGPADALVARNEDVLHFGMTSGKDDEAAPLHLELAVPLGPGPVELALAGGPVSLAALGVREHDMGLEHVDRAEVEVNGHATLAGDGASLHLSGRSRLSDLSLFHPKLAGDPVRNLRLSLAGQADVKLDGTELRLDGVEVGVGKVKVSTSGDLERTDGHATGKLHVEIPLAACADMLASIPPALVPLLGGLEVTGTFAFAGDLAFDTRRPGDTRVGWDVANACRATRVPEALSLSRFARPWTRTVLGPGDVPTTIESGPGTPAWVSYLDITPYLGTAVVVCEDASFWVHTGFNGKSIQDSIRDDLRTGKFQRGGSTVSMQLAKNLYLGREKTLSRKLQEAVLTLLLEQSLTKPQILELYLNVIEFAPGVYGIGPAAEYYFHVRPSELSLAQAFYLVSVLPNPKAHHFAADGSLTPAWASYLRHLMGVARKIQRIDDRELESGIAEEVRFGVPGAAARPDEAAPGSASPEVLDLLPPEDPAPDPGGP